MPYLCGFPVIFSLRYFFDSFLSWLNENRNAVFMRFSGYFSLRYFFDSFLSWLIENRNAVFMRFIGCFSLRYLLFFMSVYPILEVNNSWFSSLLLNIKKLSNSCFSSWISCVICFLYFICF